MRGVELVKKGFDVTIFEKEEELGGLLTYGIPAFRLPRNLSKKLEEKLKVLGIVIVNNVEFGKDFTIKSLKSEGFYAIFIGIGTEIPSKYKLCEKESFDICDATMLLREYNAKKKTDNLEKVVIIGGGNVAFDSARAALRMGAKDVKVLYRRDASRMPARKVEINHALEEGTEILYNTKVISAEIEENKVKKIKCIKTECIENTIKDIENSEFEIDATKVVFAIGYKTNKQLIEEQGIKLNEQGMIDIDDNNMTNLEGVFAGGDITGTKATVCTAILEGKKAAKRNNRIPRLVNNE